MKHLLTTLLLLACTTAQAQTQVSDSGKGSSPKTLGEVTVKASSHRLREHVESAQMGRADLPVALLLKTPAIGGEPDVIKALQLTPGVKRGTEGGIGMY